MHQSRCMFYWGVSRKGDQVSCTKLLLDPLFISEVTWTDILQFRIQTALQAHKHDAYGAKPIGISGFTSTQLTLAKSIPYIPNL